MFRQIGILWLISIGSLTAIAQDTLPRFTLVNKGNNRIIISWTNPYKDSVHQLSIQRSFDSTRNFKTLLTLPDPTVPQNGYVDTRAVTEHMFYRLFILLDSGKYLFSPSKRPVPDTAKAIPPPRKEPARPPETTVRETPHPETPVPLPPVKSKNGRDAKDSNSVVKNHPEEKPAVKEPEIKEVKKPKEIPERIFFVKRRDTLIAQVGERSLKRFKDSLALRSKDTLTSPYPDTLVIKPFVPKEIYKPSKYVFTEKDGNIRIVLPDAVQHKYAIRFFEENNSPALEIKQIKDSSLILDKANFLHAGWFKFELFEDGVLKEKNKFLITKDF